MNVFQRRAATVTDPYTTITTLPETTVSAIAETLEMRANDEAQQRLRKELLSGVSGDVLEVGTGTGVIAREVAQLSKVISVTGIDPSALLLSRAKDHGGPKETYIQAWSTNLTGIKDNSIDHAIMWTTLYHIPEIDHYATLAELKRVLKTGGTLHIFDNDPVGFDLRTNEYDPLNAALQAWIGRVFPDKYIMRRAPQLLQEAGFLPQPLRLLPVIDTSADSYGFFFVKRALTQFDEANTCRKALCQAMLEEQAARANNGQFQMVLSYAYVRSIKR